jgi:YD repeat-containing protein
MQSSWSSVYVILSRPVGKWATAHVSRHPDRQGNGSTTTFHPTGGGSFSGPPRVFATLTQNGDGTYTFVRRRRETFVFSSAGQLLTETDLNGYTTTLAYDGQGHLLSVSEPAGRTLTFAHDGGGHITSATDPIGRTVTYAYNAAGDLITVTDPAGGSWHFTYDAAHRMLTMTDPRGGTLSNSYNASGQVTSQTDPLGHLTTFAYGAIADGTETTITSPNGNVTVEDYVAGELTPRTKGAGTPSAATWTYAYDQSTLGVIAETDPNGHVTQHSYDADGNQTSVTDPLGRTTTTTYNNLDEPLVTTDPLGDTTTNVYDAEGNLQSVARPLAGTALVQTTTYHYGDGPVCQGDVRHVR